MKIFFNVRDGKSHRRRGVYGAAAAIACIALVSCAKTIDNVQGPGSEQVSHSPIVVTTPANFDVALKENQTALAAGKIAPDVALYNTGFLLAHPSNPKKDYPKATLAFQTLLAEHPRSSLLEPAKTWIQCLEQQQKVAEERRKLAEEKLALEIEKRRRQTLSK